MTTKELKEAYYKRTKDVFTCKLSDGRYLEVIEQLNGNLYCILYQGVDSIGTMTIAQAAKMLRKDQQ